jgi:hypothetical protein
MKPDYVSSDMLRVLTPLQPCAALGGSISTGRALLFFLRKTRHRGGMRTQAVRAIRRVDGLNDFARTPVAGIGLQSERLQKLTRSAPTRCAHDQQ